jgi:hypothetical protein
MPPVNSRIRTMTSRMVSMVAVYPPAHAHIQAWSAGALSRAAKEPCPCRALPHRRVLWGRRCVRSPGRHLLGRDERRGRRSCPDRGARRLADDRPRRSDARRVGRASCPPADVQGWSPGPDVQLGGRQHARLRAVFRGRTNATCRDEPKSHRQRPKTRDMRDVRPTPTTSPKPLRSPPEAGGRRRSAAN